VSNLAFFHYFFFLGGDRHVGDALIFFEHVWMLYKMKRKKKIILAISDRFLIFLELYASVFEEFQCESSEARCVRKKSFSPS